MKDLSSIEYRLQTEYNFVIRSARELLNEEVKGEERLYHWCAFIRNYKSAAGALLRYLALSGNSSANHHRCKNSQKNSPVLRYILHARNALDHADEREDVIPKYLPDAIGVPGLLNIDLGGSGSAFISVEDCKVNGREVSGTLKFNGNKVDVTGSLSGNIFFRKKRIELVDVSDVNGNIYRFPHEEVPSELSPEVLAAYVAVCWFNEWIEQGDVPVQMMEL